MKWKGKQAVQNIEQRVRAIFEAEGTGHDWWHVDRVRRVALRLARHEKAERTIVQLAALLHDVPDPKLQHGGEEKGLNRVASWFRAEKVPKHIATHVLHIIQNMSFSKSFEIPREEQSIEFKIVQDADRLEAIGAIGIARAFAYGGAKHRPLYDPHGKTKKYSSRQAYKKGPDSSLHHLQEKGFKIYSMLNTESARKMARNRSKFLKQFVAQFLQEWRA